MSLISIKTKLQHWNGRSGRRKFLLNEDEKARDEIVFSSSLLLSFGGRRLATFSLSLSLSLSSSIGTFLLFLHLDSPPSSDWLRARSQNCYNEIENDYDPADDADDDGDSREGWMGKNVITLLLLLLLLFVSRLACCWGYILCVYVCWLAAWYWRPLSIVWDCLQRCCLLTLHKR